MKICTAAKMNANDAQMKGKVMRNNNGTERQTYKLLDDLEPGIEHIVDSDGTPLATLMIGTGGRWQLLSIDCATFKAFASYPSLADCIAILIKGS